MHQDSERQHPDLKIPNDHFKNDESRNTTDVRFPCKAAPVYSRRVNKEHLI